MIWLMLATLVVVFIIGFRVLNSDARRASQALTKRLNIEPVYVESMLSQMGKTAGGEFIQYLLQDSESHMGNAAGVLLIYQTFIVDESEESFLRELEPDPNEMASYRLRYNARFTAVVPEGEASNSNVFYIDGSSHRD